MWEFAINVNFEKVELANSLFKILKKDLSKFDALVVLTTAAVVLTAGGVAIAVGATAATVSGVMVTAGAATAVSGLAGIIFYKNIYPVLEGRWLF